MSDTTQEAPRARVLVVEDSAVFREMQGLLLGQAGYEVSLHESPQTALTLASQQHFDLVVIDYELPQMNGQQFMHALRLIQPDIAVIFVSGSLTLNLAIELSSEGVAGIFNKPANPKTLLEKVNETLARHSARDTAARVGSGSPQGGRGAATGHLPVVEPAADQLAFSPRHLPGSSPVLRDFTHRIWKVRDFRSVLLLQGEAGSPFEALARDLIEISIFRDGPIMVSSATEFEPRRLIQTLAPSLLSHDAGTLVVSGVETFNPDQQAALNNLMSGRDIFLPFARRFRLVLAATGRLWDRVEDGTFDETLYYKITSLSLAVPNLRDMRSDIPVIAQAILSVGDGGENSTPGPELAPEAAEWLEAQPWPENYAQLRRTVLAAVPRAENGRITLAALQVRPTSAVPAPRPVPAEATPEKRAVAPVPSPSTARPPFPISSDLAAEARPASSPVAPPAPPPKPARAPAAAKPGTTPSPTAAAVAQAPASRLFARPAAEPARPLATRSLFRPASQHYQFTKRLEEVLALAEADPAN